MTGLEESKSPATIERGTAAAVLSPIRCLVILAASLLIPIVAHGCHGDDVDHEPGFGLPADARK